MPDDSSSGSRERLAPGEHEEIDVRDEYARRGARLRDLLHAAARTRRAPPDGVFDHETAPPVRPRLGGCLMRLILVMIFLFIALTTGVSMLGGSLFRLFLPY